MDLFVGHQIKYYVTEFESILSVNLSETFLRNLYICFGNVKNDFHAAFSYSTKSYFIVYRKHEDSHQ